MNARSNGARGLVAGLSLSVLLLCAAAGQPGTPPAGGQPAPGRGAGAGNQQPMDGKALRELIDRRMEEHQQGIKRLEEAQKKLNGGGDPAVIGRELLESLRDSRRGGQGGGAARREGGDRPGGDEAGGTPGGGGPTAGRNRGGEFGGLLGGPRLNPEERAKLKASMKEKHPALLAKIEQFTTEDPELRDRFIDGVGNKLRWIESMKEKEPEEFNLRLEELSSGLDLMRLGRQVTDAKKNNASEAEITALRAKLRTQMNAAFDTRQAIARLQIQQLKKRAEDLEKAIDKKQSEREATVDRQTDEFLKMIEAGKPKKD